MPSFLCLIIDKSECLCILAVDIGSPGMETDGDQSPDTLNKAEIATHEAYNQIVYH